MLLAPLFIGCLPEEAEDQPLWNAVEAIADSSEDANADATISKPSAKSLSVSTHAKRFGKALFHAPAVDRSLGGRLGADLPEAWTLLPEFFQSHAAAPVDECMSAGSGLPPFHPQAARWRHRIRSFRHGHVGHEFVGCAVATARIGGASWRHDNKTELSLGAMNGAADVVADFDWRPGETYAFSLSWDGSVVIFQVGETVLSEEYACDAVNAIQLRARANKSVLEVRNLVANDEPVDAIVSSGRRHGDDLHVMHIINEFEDGLLLTGEIYVDWNWWNPPRNSQLGLEIAIGAVDADEADPDPEPEPDPEPIVDCNANGVADDLDIADGVSDDCDFDGVPDECQADSDGDGVIDLCDECPDDPAKIAAGACGCNVDDVDSDGDGVLDCDDLCPDTREGAIVDADGCEIFNIDAGADLTIDQVAPVQLTAEAAGGSPPYTYAWSANGWAGSSSSAPVIMPHATTVYTLVVVDSSTPPVELRDEITIAIAPPDGLRYEIADLGALSANGIYPSGVNDQGDVVGYYRDDGGAMRAFLYRDGALADLGTLGGAEAYARDVNNAGQVVGQAVDGDGNWRAFLWDEINGMVDLGTLGGASSDAYSVNESGQVVGYADDGAGYQAFVYENGAIRALPISGYLQSGVFDINDAGEMSGLVVPATGDPHAVVFDADGAMLDLGAYVAGGTQAWNINDVGMVTGYAWGSGAYRSFVYGADEVLDLGLLSGFSDAYVYGLNDRGVIVGIASGASVSHAFVYSGGRMLDLNDLLVEGHGWDELTAAFAVNNNGQIVGYGLVGGEVRAFILTPAQ